MKREEFAARVKAFSQAPQPYRHLYLWHGEADALLQLLPSGRVQQLNLFALTAELDERPLGDEEARAVLCAALRAYLREWAQAEIHPILVVTGCELLARYRAGLACFYEVLTTRSMVILTCSAADSSYDPGGRLPAYVHYEPGAASSYLTKLIEENHLIEA